jgi:uncharacterized PurR-regulated membrane protein YhhQ (DUF165 family)
MASLHRLAVPVLAMVVVVAGSNLAVQYPINDWLTWGAFTYPVAFLVTDLTNRRLGPVSARRVVYVGFALGVLLSMLVAGPRIALASGTAFLSAQLLDIWVFDRLRRLAWWRAPRCSSPLPSPAAACPGPPGRSAIWPRRAPWRFCSCYPSGL